VQLDAHADLRPQLGSAQSHSHAAAMRRCLEVLQWQLAAIASAAGHARGFAELRHSGRLVVPPARLSSGKPERLQGDLVAALGAPARRRFT